MTPQQIIELIATYNYLLSMERSGMVNPGTARAWADSSLDPEQHDVVLAYITRCSDLAVIVRQRLSAAIQGGDK